MTRFSWQARAACGAVLALVLVAGQGPALAAPPPTDTGAAVTPAQRAALDALSPEMVLFDEAGVPTFLEGRLGSYDPGQPSRSAFDLLATLGPALRATHRDELRQTRAAADELGKTHVRLQQYIDGLPVVGGDLVVHLDSKTQEVELVNGRFLAAGALDLVPSLDPHQAFEGLQAAMSHRGAFTLKTEPELAVVFGPDGRGRLAWAGTADYVDATGERQLDRFFVDARTGQVLERHPLLHRVLNREVWDAQNSNVTPLGALLIREGATTPSPDAAAQAAYDFSGDAWDYFDARHGRDSYDDGGALIRSSVHFGVNYNNAYWCGAEPNLCPGDRVLTFGDGDGTQYGNFAQDRDVVAHEFTHAVTEFTAGLVYANESGALNEAMSDVFAAATDERENGLSADTWRLGEGVFTPNIAGDALRYMNNPTADGESKDYYPERYIGTDDSGGVHKNSGIANLAFYLLSQGGTHPRGKTSVSVRSIGLSDAASIFFRALHFYMTSSETFADVRQHTARAAVDLFGHNSRQHRAVCEAWDAVAAPGWRIGVCLTAGDGPAAPDSVTVESLLCYGYNDVTWSPVAGATRYEVYASVWAYDFNVAGRVYSGPATWTTINVPGNRYIRVKTCTASGCGPLSLSYGWAYRYPGCN